MALLGGFLVYVLDHNVFGGTIGKRILVERAQSDARSPLGWLVGARTRERGLTTFSHRLATGSPLKSRESHQERGRPVGRFRTGVVALVVLTATGCSTNTQPSSQERTSSIPPSTQKQVSGVATGDACAAFGKLLTQAAAAGGKPGWQWQEAKEMDLSGVYKGKHADGAKYVEYGCYGYIHAPGYQVVEKPGADGEVYVILHVDASPTPDDTVHDRYNTVMDKCRMDTNPISPVAGQEAQPLGDASKALSNQVHSQVLRCGTGHAAFTDTGLRWHAIVVTQPVVYTGAPPSSQDADAATKNAAPDLLLLTWLREIGFNGETSFGFRPVVIPTVAPTQ